MPNFSESSISCRSCGETSTARVFHSINVTENPELKSKVKSGEIFLHTCPHCGTKNLLGGNFLYTDTDERIIIILSDANIDDSGLDRDYTARQVSTVGELIEKVGIFDDGLDDVALELCKEITKRESGKDISLKYLKLDGADGEITFTYPENGKMEMLAVGFNVYEDCRGIVERNPIFKEKSAGLCRVDADFISKIIR